MHTKLIKRNAVGRLERVLDVLDEELIHSTDAELLQAARELGMDPMMRGSAAFIGLKYPFQPRPADFFDWVGHDAAQIRLDRSSPALARSGKKQLERKSPGKRGKRRGEPEDE